MSRFRRRKHKVPGLNMASMPDLIFTVLFFFMIVTHMRQTELKVRYVVPEGTELEKAAHKGSTVYLYVGTAIGQQGETTSAADRRIQIGNRYVSTAEIPGAIAHEREQMSPDERQRLTVCIYADRQTDMGLINDVKQALRQAGALRINYIATQQAVQAPPAAPATDETTNN